MSKARLVLLPLLAAFPFTFALSQLPESPGGGSLDHLPVFTEIAKQAGVAYRITCGDEVTEYLIDVNGEGAAFLDYDNDGDQDLYLANGSSRKLQKAGNPPHDYLLRNNGDGTFSDVTQKAGLGDTEWSSGAAVGDYNNDGFLDLYVTNFGPNKLYRNNGDGTFSDVSEKSGVAGPHWDMPKWSMGAAFGDYDNDGYVDLYVTNFARFNYQPELPPPSPASPCRMKGVPIACAPDKYQGTQDLLYHNNGDGTFSDVSESSGITRKDPGRGFAVVFSDFDNDGDQDIYVANDAGPNFYYINDGKGKFVDASLESGTSVDEFGNAQGSMGLTVGDYNRDGLMDIFITNFIDQRRTIYQNMGSNQFQDSTTNSGIGMIGFPYSGWGTKFFDFDNDGWLDLFFCNGHTMEQPEREFPADTFAEPSYLMRNVQGRFSDVSKESGIRRLSNKVSRGTAFGDFDNDGDIDMVVIHKNDVPYFLRNDGGNRKNWITLRTEGVKSNRAGIGARVVVSAGKARQIFEVRGSDSYLSSNDLRVHAGLDQEKVADVEIRWPSGQVDRHSQVAANRHYWAKEGGELLVDPRCKAVGSKK
jgi:enediyne biosynthesis protein E4